MQAWGYMDCSNCAKTYTASSRISKCFSAKQSLPSVSEISYIHIHNAHSLPYNYTTYTFTPLPLCHPHVLPLSLFLTFFSSKGSWQRLISSSRLISCRSTEGNGWKGCDASCIRLHRSCMNETKFFTEGCCCGGRGGGGGGGGGVSE